MYQTSPVRARPYPTKVQPVIEGRQAFATDVVAEGENHADFHVDDRYALGRLVIARSDLLEAIEDSPPDEP